MLSNKTQLALRTFFTSIVEMNPELIDFNRKVEEELDKPVHDPDTFLPTVMPFLSKCTETLIRYAESVDVEDSSSTLLSQCMEGGATEELMTSLMDAETAELMRQGLALKTAADNPLISKHGKDALTDYLKKYDKIEYMIQYFQPMYARIYDELIAVEQKAG